MADNLSKGTVGQVMEDLLGSKNISDSVSKTMLTWLSKPKVGMELGRSALLELAAKPDLDFHVGGFLQERCSGALCGLLGKQVLWNGNFYRMCCVLGSLADSRL